MWILLYAMKIPHNDSLYRSKLQELIIEVSPPSLLLENHLINSLRFIQFKVVLAEDSLRLRHRLAHLSKKANSH